MGLQLFNQLSTPDMTVVNESIREQLIYLRTNCPDKLIAAQQYVAINIPYLTDGWLDNYIQASAFSVIDTTEIRPIMRIANHWITPNDARLFTTYRNMRDVFGKSLLCIIDVSNAYRDVTFNDVCAMSTAVTICNSKQGVTLVTDNFVPMHGWMPDVAALRQACLNFAEYCNRDKTKITRIYIYGELLNPDELKNIRSDLTIFTASPIDTALPTIYGDAFNATLAVERLDTKYGLSQINYLDNDTLLTLAQMWHIDPTSETSIAQLKLKLFSYIVNRRTRLWLVYCAERVIGVYAAQYPTTRVVQFSKIWLTSYGRQLAASLPMLEVEIYNRARRDIRTPVNSQETMYGIYIFNRYVGTYVANSATSSWYLTALNVDQHLQ